MKEFTELTDGTSLTSWIPVDEYADLILDAVFCGRKLSGVITAGRGFDWAAGRGAICQVRYFPSRTAQTGVGCIGACLSAASSTVGTYSITIKAYGDRDKMCGFSLWEANGPVKEGILRSMGNALATKFDQDIWAGLVGFKPTYYSKTSAACTNRWDTRSTYCCEYKYDLYNAVVSASQGLKSRCYNPDYVILDPSVAKWFYFKDTATIPLVKFSADGQLLEVAGLKVIETGNATDCASTSGATMAVVIDSSRAIGEAWGKRPTFEEVRDPGCDIWDEVVWAYWGTHVLDQNAIIHIINA